MAPLLQDSVLGFKSHIQWFRSQTMPQVNDNIDATMKQFIYYAYFSGVKLFKKEVSEGKIYVPVLYFAVLKKYALNSKYRKETYKWEKHQY